MAALNDLISQAMGKKDLVAMTVRVPEKIHFFVEHLAASAELSRQEVLLTLLQAGVDEAMKQIEAQSKDDAPTEGKTSFFLLNTNKAHTDDDHEMMMQEGVAAAFYDPWKLQIERIKKGDWVFLYENRKGIVAYGRGTGETQRKPHRGNIDECYFQELAGFTKLKEPLTAREIKETLGRSPLFMKVLSSVRGGEKLLEKLTEQSRP